METPNVILGNPTFALISCMQNSYFADQIFEKIAVIQPGEYDHCIFKNCAFESADFKNIKFLDCRFISCNVSLVQISGASLQKVHFADCKMQGLRFEACNPFLFEVSFERCTLHLSSFYQVKTKGTSFLHCNLQEVDFTEATFTKAIFDECDLSGALFDHTNLIESDFRTAHSYQINPSINQIKKAKFSKDGLAGLVQSFGITIS
jgi:fluoroquinolone resistance protein